jgi:hypothetical protein
MTFEDRLSAQPDEQAGIWGPRQASPTRSSLNADDVDDTGPLAGFALATKV